MKRKRSQSPHSTSSEIAPEEIPLPLSRSLTPQAPESPVLVSEALPLSSENLQRLPGSPPRHPGTNSTMSYSKSSVSIGSSSSPTPHDVRAFLGIHGMYLKDKEFYQSHPELIETVNKIMNKESQTEMRPESAEKIIKNVQRLATRTERKFFEEFWNRLFKDTHPVKEVDGDGKWVTTEWDVQGLDNNPDSQFALRGISALNPSSELHRKILKELPRVQHPKPDQAFGVAEHMFSDDENRINALYQNWTGISSGMYHTFSVIEFKGYGGSMVEAENQSLRAGSALVEVNRALRNEAKMQALDKPGVDTSSIAFSFCMTTETAKLFVHWAKVGEKADEMTKYIMSELRQYILTSDKDLTELRRDVERVLDWGTIDRLRGPSGVRALLKNIIHIKSQPSQPSQPDNSNKAAKHSENSSAGQESRKEG